MRFSLEAGGMILKDRETAARQLAERLKSCRDPLVLAIPRGAVPMGRILAEALGGDLDVVLVRKLRALFQPELAIGAVDETGRFELNEGGAYLEGEGAFGEEYLAGEVRRQVALLQTRRARYSAECPTLEPEGRTVIVVDDGVATGSTLLAALQSVQARRPARLIAAVGVAPPVTVARLEREADEVVALSVPSSFNAVSQFFEDFREVSDEEVIQHLRDHARAKTETQGHR